MKKIAGLLIISMMVFSLVGCGKEAGASGNSSTDTADVKTDEVIITNDTEDTAPDTSADAGTSGELRFSTVDIDGNPVTDEIIRDAKVVMVNFWEPWCGPCVGEMPDLETLYEEYKEKGLLVIGVFSTTDMDDDAKAILEQCGTTYPVVRSDENLTQFMTDYVPTTIFADANGKLLSKEPVIGANSYDNWKNIIESYLD